MNILFWKKKKIEVQEDDSEFNINSISEDDFSKMLKYGKPSDTIGKWKSKPFIELPYGIVKKELPARLNSGDAPGAVELIMNKSNKDFKINKANPNDVICFLIWIKNQIEFIKAIEDKNLQSEPEPELMAAGIHRLNEFGIMPVVEKIAKDWNLTPDEVEEMPYYRIYEKIKLDKIQNEINKNYQKIIEEKAKRKFKTFWSGNEV